MWPFMCCFGDLDGDCDKDYFCDCDSDFDHAFINNPDTKTLFV